MHITLADYLNEQSEYYTMLYHWVSISKMQDILNKDTMFGKFKHRIGNKDYYGNSLSRNKDLLINYSYIRLTFNKDLYDLSKKTQKSLVSVMNLTKRILTLCKNVLLNNILICLTNRTNKITI